jgi:hypothetical protein
MFFLFPAWQISRYLLFFATLLNHWRMFPNLTDRDFTTFLMAYVIFHILWVTFAPLVSTPFTDLTGIHARNRFRAMHVPYLC